MVNRGDFVLVSTEYRGIFAGVLAKKDNAKRIVVLKKARCAIYWGTTGGFLELANRGPNTKSKIGDEAPEITLYGVTSVTWCSKSAEDAWKDPRRWSG